MLHLPSGAFHPICAKRRAKDRAHVKRRIEQAVLATFDARRSRLLELCKRASVLRLPDDYHRRVTPNRTTSASAQPPVRHRDRPRKPAHRPPV